MIYRFADCILDTDRHRLDRDGTEVHVEPQVFDTLTLLAEYAPDLVSYDTLIEQVWRGRIVSDATLAARISAARAAVGDDGKRQALIRTVARRGVQMVVQVETEAGRLASDPARAVSAAPPPRQTIRYTTSPDGNGIAYAVCGEGPPLLRGGHWLSHLEHDWTSPIWRPLLERLSARHTLVRYDPRGTGLSERRLGNANVERLADDMEAVADAAGLDRFPIIAASQSAPVAIALAARRPDRVSRMVLYSAFAQGPDARGDTTASEAMIALIRTGWGVPGSAFMTAMASIFLPTGSRAEVDSLVEMQALSADANTAADLRRVIGGIDVTPLLEKVTAPTLVIHFSRDAVQPVEQGRMLARTLPKAEFREFDSPNHMAPPSDPVWPQMMDEIDRFLETDTGA